MVDHYPKPPSEPPMEEEVSTSSVVISWEPSGEPDVKGYEIYKSTSPSSVGELAGSVEADVSSFKVEDLDPGTEYFFTVRVVDEGGLYADAEQLEVKTRESFNLTLIIGVAFVALVVLVYALRKNLKGA